MLFWCSIGVTLTIIWIIKLLKIENFNKILIVLLFFLGFSGLDFIGVFLTGSVKSFESMHLEWWALFFQYSSMITQLFWVFNQCIIPWIITLMFLNEKSVNNYALLILICFSYGPLPSLGLIPLMVIKAIYLFIKALKDKKVNYFLKDIFSIENIFSIFAIFPIYALYYFNNSAVSNGGDGDGGIRLVKEIFHKKGIIALIEFYILEFGIYGLILFKENKKNIIFLTSFISLFFIPLISIGFGYDFSMRVSIPALVIINFCFLKFILEKLNKYNIKSLIELFRNRKIDLKLGLVIFIFSIGLITPIVELQRGLFNVIENKKLALIADDIITFSNDEEGEYLNFLCNNPKENSIFFKYIARK